MNQNEQQKLWAKIVAKAWADEDYKQRLLDEPAAVLRAEGLTVPEGVEINVVEATAKKVWLVLPMQSGEGAVVGEERLAAIMI
ncbi:MAG: NHLP leader peptide family RiPP precursor [Humidesulfovibrio sp.]|jgi:hypothetical protein|uniref:NHLP leader peptide family RiPP precursor n=1 Tax=Humidesulfovibrio sp. TaxID=2910988 RepID=UPI002732411B|nr:NHLP leader peptide family RiPP precursor [Humidesulfovibrio sp.]MDP2846740.1 NHLP leader peptide family RiPP precursor [Humidesulfovibrio sp.]